MLLLLRIYFPQHFPTFPLDYNVTHAAKRYATTQYKNIMIIINFIKGIFVYRIRNGNRGDKAKCGLQSALFVRKYSENILLYNRTMEIYARTWILGSDFIFMYE